MTFNPEAVRQVNWYQSSAKKAGEHDKTEAGTHRESIGMLSGFSVVVRNMKQKLCDVM